MNTVLEVCFVFAVVFFAALALLMIVVGPLLFLGTVFGTFLLGMVLGVQGILYMAGLL